MAPGRSSRALAEDMADWARETRATGQSSGRISQALAEELTAWARGARAGMQPGTAAEGAPRRSATTTSTYARGPAAQSAGRPLPPRGAPSVSSRYEDNSWPTAGPSGYNQNLSSSGPAQHDMRRQASRRGSVSKRNQRAIDALIAQDKKEQKDRQAADAQLRHEDAIYAKGLIGREQAEASDRRAAAALTRETDSGDGMSAGSASAPASWDGGLARELENLYTRPGLAETNSTTPSERNHARLPAQRRSATNTVNEDRRTPQTFARETGHTPAATAAAAAAEDAWVQQLREIRAASEAVEASRRAASSSADAERIAREVQLELERIRHADTDSLRTATTQNQRAVARPRVSNAHNPRATSTSASVDPVAREVQQELDRIRRSDADTRRATAAQNPSASGSNATAAPATGDTDVFAQGMRDLTLDERRAAISAHTLSQRGSAPQSSGAASVPSSPTTPIPGLRRVATAPSTQSPRRSRTPPSPERLALLAELYEMEPREQPEIPFVRLIGDHDPPSVLAEFVADLDLAYPPPPRWHMDLRFNVHVRITADERRRVRFDVRVIVELEIRDV